MQRFPKLLIIAATFCGAASLAHAQGPGRGPMMDADGDGKVSPAEFEASGLQRFQRMDENHDGLIDKAEATALRKRQADRMMDEGVPPSIMATRPTPIADIDLDKDGQVTREEAVAAQAARFKAADKNGDGFLDADEQQAVRGRGPGGPPPPR